MNVKQSFRAILPTGLRIVFFMILAASIGAGSGFAQSTGGRIRGTVTDPSGGAVVGAKGELINEATNVSREAVTNSTGEYLFLEIPVGTYSVQIEQAGFKQFLHQGLELNVNDVLNVDAALQVGGSNQVVEVSGEPPVWTQRRRNWAPW